jgi:hypothetical protein
MPVNTVDVARSIPNLLEYEPHNIFHCIGMIFMQQSENDWNIPIFHEPHKIPQHWDEYYGQSAIDSELLMIDDIVCKNHWKDYHLLANEWDCNCKDEYMTV